VRFGIAHAKDAKDGKEFLFLKNLCDLSDRGVRFGMVHDPQLRDALSRAKYAKDGKEILFLKIFAALATVA